MQSEKQHIDNYIRKKEAEWSQDSGLQDLHWAKMQSLLPRSIPTVTGKKVSIRTSRHIVKYLGGFVVVTVITLVTLTAVRHKRTIAPTKSSSQKEAIAHNSNTARANQKIDEPKTSPNTLVNTSSKTKQEANHLSATPSQSSIPGSQASIKIGQRLDSAKSLTPTSKPDAMAVLNEFYSRIEKNGQGFTVQGNRDTTLIAAEGTKLTVPANSFVNKAGQLKNGTIKIVLKEYYRYDDIVAAKLNTTSNGEQLVTGGMLHVTAVSGNEELKLAPGKSINIKMPTNHFDPDMQLFMGSSTSGTDYSTTASQSTRDTGKTQSYAINWTPVGQPQGMWMTGQRTRTIRVMDWSIEPRHVRGPSTNTKAVFFVKKDFPMSDDEVKEKLREKYGDYYNRIKLRRVDNPKYENTEPGFIILVDSVDMTLKEAFKKHLVPKKDSAKLMTQMLSDSVHYFNQSKIYDNYDFTITGLGWINCDRFLKYKGPKTDFAINLGQDVDAGNFVTQLVFTRFKSVLAGPSFSDHKLYFKNIPLNEQVQLVCVGVKGDKVISCVQTLTVTKQGATDLNFEETTPEQLKAKLKTLNF